MEDDGREVENAGDAGLDKVLATSWAAAAWTVRMAMLMLLLADNLGEFVHAVNGLGDFFVALALRVNVEAATISKPSFSKPR